LKNSFNMFLLLAEELSFNKAAKRAFINTAVLQRPYKKAGGTVPHQFFYRKPEIALTLPPDNETDSSADTDAGEKHGGCTGPD